MVYKKGLIFLAVSLDFGLILEANTLQVAFEKLKEVSHNYLLDLLNKGKNDDEIYVRLPEKYEQVFSFLKELEESNPPSANPDHVVGEMGFQFRSRSVGQNESILTQ